MLREMMVSGQSLQAYQKHKLPNKGVILLKSKQKES